MNYLTPQMECVEISTAWSLCEGSGNTGGGDDNGGNKFAPERRAPKF